MFDLDVLKSQTTVEWLNRVMTKLRQQARSAPLTHFHRFIVQAFESGRLLRLYTQNFDGLQTREHPDVKARVFEVHGTNYELICRTCNRHPTRPVHEYDDMFLGAGIVPCPWCQENADKAQDARKRARAIGHLVPNILFNGDTTHPVLDQHDLVKMQAADSCALLLLVVGTSMKVQGIKSMVRTLAKGVHDRGGLVVYVDRSDLASSWRNVFNLHIQGDIQELFQGVTGQAQERRWAKPRLLQEVSQLFGGHQHNIFLERLKMQKQIHSRLAGQAPLPETVASLDPGVSSCHRVALVVFVHGWNMSFAKTLIAEALGTWARSGWECRYEAIDLDSEEVQPPQPLEWPTYHAVLVYVAPPEDSVAACESSVGRRPDVREMLEIAVERATPIVNPSRSCQAILVCSDSRLPGGDKPSRLCFFPQHIPAYDNILICLARAPVAEGGWARFVTNVTLSMCDPRGDLLQPAADCWTKELGRCVDLLVLLALGQAVMLLGCELPNCPLGRALPPAETTCPCVPDPSIKAVKCWNIRLLVEIGLSITGAEVTIACSNCKRRQRLATDGMRGVFKRLNSMYYVEAPLFV
ncbi:hypothetical protein FS749_010747 [Ceratobasidium sp. UAMH 11750]|nr:hypothetical protein FS749_010747 [Ceratobasidium sp. UAMH 11750]